MADCRSPEMPMDSCNPMLSLVTTVKPSLLCAAADRFLQYGETGGQA
jgi:hypothetical protein